MQIDMMVIQENLGLTREETTTPVFRNDKHYVKCNENPERLIIEYFASHVVENLLRHTQKDHNKLVKSTNQNMTFITEGKRPKSPISLRPVSPVALVSPNLRESDKHHQVFNIIADLPMGHTLRKDQLMLLARIIVVRWLIADYDMNATNVEILTKSISQDKLDADNAPTELLSFDYGLSFYPVIEPFTDENKEKKILPECFTNPQDIHELMLGCLFDKSCQILKQDDIFYDDHTLIQSASCLQNRETLSQLAAEIIPASRSLTSMDGLMKSIQHIAMNTLGELILIDLHLQKPSEVSIDTLTIVFDQLQSRNYRKSIEGKKFCSTLKSILKKWPKKQRSPELQSVFDKINSKIQVITPEQPINDKKPNIPNYSNLLNPHNLCVYDDLLARSSVIFHDRLSRLKQFLDQPFSSESLKDQYAKLSKLYGYNADEIDTQWIDDISTSANESKPSVFDRTQTKISLFIPLRHSETKEITVKTKQFSF